jgi:hypothetical protein
MPQQRYKTRGIKEEDRKLRREEKCERATVEENDKNTAF